MIDVDAEKGGLELNKDFFVDFGTEPNGPALPHGMFPLISKYRNFLRRFKNS